MHKEAVSSQSGCLAQSLVFGLFEAAHIFHASSHITVIPLSCVVYVFYVVYPCVSGVLLVFGRKR